MDKETVYYFKKKKKEEEPAIDACLSLFKRNKMLVWDVRGDEYREFWYRGDVAYLEPSISATISNPPTDPRNLPDFEELVKFADGKADNYPPDNFFLETGSVCRWNGRKYVELIPGWMHRTSPNMDALFYYFKKPKLYYILPFARLQKWFLKNEKHILLKLSINSNYMYVENDGYITKGIAVPIPTVLSKVKAITGKYGT